MEQKFPRKSQAVKTYISTRMKAVDFEKGKIKPKHSPYHYISTTRPVRIDSEDLHYSFLSLH